MQYSTEYLAVIVLLLTKFLPLIGINLDANAISTTVTSLIAVCSGLWLLYKRFQKGGVSPLGFRKN